MDRYTVYYSAANNRNDEILLSALSIAINSGKPVDFFVLTMSAIDMSLGYRPFSSKKAKKIERILKETKPDTTFSVIDLQKEYVSAFGTPRREWTGRSPYPLLRLLLLDNKDIKDPYLILDSDVVALGDIGRLFDIDTAGLPFAAAKKGRKFDTGAVMVVPALLKDKDKPEIRPESAPYSEVLLYGSLFGGRSYVYEEGLITRGVPAEKTILKHFSRNGSPRKGLLSPLHSTDTAAVLRKLDDERIRRVYLPYAEIVSNEGERSAKARQKAARDYIIDISHLYKTYGRLKAVDDVSFRVKRGSLFAFLGLNGAGKSTTINIISSILDKDYGKIIIDGKDLDHEKNAIKREIGIVFQTSTLDDELTAYENLSTRAEFYGISGKEKKERIAKIVMMLGLEPLLNRPVKNLSGGQRRRLDIARSMIHEPTLLILDEPTTGLDPKTRQDVWRLIDSIREKTGMTVFLTTHYLEEAEQATDVVIMDHGRIIAQGSPVELKNRYASDYVMVYSPRRKELDALLKGKSSYVPDAGGYRFFVKDPEEALRFVNSHGDLIKDFEIKKGTMDDVFLDVTGINIKESKENGDENV